MYQSSSSDDLLKLNDSSQFYCQSGMTEIVLKIKPLDQKIRQLNVSVKISHLYQGMLQKVTQNTNQINQQQQNILKYGQRQDQSIQYEQCFQFQDFFKTTTKIQSHNIIKGLKQSQSAEQTKDVKRFMNLQTKSKQNPQNNLSLLWIKLYLEQYFAKVFANLKSSIIERNEEGRIQEPSEESQIFNFTDELYMKQIYKSKRNVSDMLQDSRQIFDSSSFNTMSQNGQQNSEQSYKQPNSQFKFLLLKIEPERLGYDYAIFSTPLIMVLPKKIRKDQKILSSIEINSQMHRIKTEEIQKIFYDNKLI